MKFLVIIMLMASCESSQAADFRKYIDLMKKEVNRILGKEPKLMQITMPDIPQVKKDATNTSVYDKKGKVFDQGKEFTKLSQDEKRKFNLAFLRELYMAVRGAEAKNTELVTNLNVLEQGGSRESVYRSIVLSQDYLALEAFKNPPETKLLDYGMRFGEKYLALKFSKDQMQHLNLYSIKRILSEKALEVMDAFPKDGEDLYRWYAIFSEDVARNYGNILKNSVRKNTKIDYHYRWAKKVPFQHIKSEVVVKLHKVMNSF